MKAVKIADKIESKYGRYLRESEDSLLGGEHLGDSIKERGTGWAEGNVNDLDRECWIVFDEDLPEIAALPTTVLELLPIQLTPILRIQVTDDHRQYWAWTAAVVDVMGDENAVIGENIDRFFKILVDLMLSKLTSRPTNREDQQQNLHIRENVSPHTMRVTTMHYPVVGTYFSYPILEGILKRLSDTYINPNGKIKKNQFIQGMYHRYVPPGNEECSSIRDISYHYHNIVADTKTKKRLDAIQPKIEEYGNEPMYEIIDDWRNFLLHGQDLGGVEAGVLLNLICLLIWNQIDAQQYNDDWEDIYRRATSTPDAFKYYPAE